MRRSRRCFDEPRDDFLAFRGNDWPFGKMTRRAFAAPSFPRSAYCRIATADAAHPPLLMPPNTADCAIPFFTDPYATLYTMPAMVKVDAVLVYGPDVENLLAV